MATTTDRYLERRLFVLRLLSSMGVPAHEVEDVAQDTLLKFLTRKYDELDLPDGRERALLGRIGYSTWLDIVRRRRPIDLEDAPQEALAVAAMSGPDGIRRHVAALMRLARLGVDEIELLEMRYGLGLSAARIARDAGLHPNTVRRRLARVLDALRRIEVANGHEEAPIARSIRA